MLLQNYLKVCPDFRLSPVTNPLNSSSSPLKIILNNSHFTAILPINIQNNYGYVPLNINDLKKKDSFNSDNEIVYEILN